MGNQTSSPITRPSGGSGSLESADAPAFDNIDRMAVDAPSVLNLAAAYPPTSDTQSPASRPYSRASTPSLANDIFSSGSRRRPRPESVSTSASSISRRDRDRDSGDGSKGSIGRKVVNAFKRGVGSRSNSYQSSGGGSVSYSRGSSSSNIPKVDGGSSVIGEFGDRRIRDNKGESESKRRKIAERDVKENVRQLEPEQAIAEDVVMDSVDASDHATGIELAPPIVTDVHIAQPGPATIPTISVPGSIEVPARGPLSPPIVPLSVNDPLLDDRLRTLSTIREFLGSEIASSLPSVAEAAAVVRRRESIADSLRSRRTIPDVEGGDEEGTTAVQENDGVDHGMTDTQSLPVMPASTISLLQDLEAEESARQAVAVIGALPQVVAPAEEAASSVASDSTDSPGTTAEAHIENPAPSDGPAFGSGSVGLPADTDGDVQMLPASVGESLRRSDNADNSAISRTRTASLASNRRHSRIGQIADRLTGWLGLNNDEPTSAGHGADSMDVDMDNHISSEAVDETGNVLQAEQAGTSATPSVGNAASAEESMNPPASAASLAADGTRAEEGTAATPAGLRHHGPLMLVQGFVQTSIRHTPRPETPTSSPMQPPTPQRSSTPVTGMQQSSTSAVAATAAPPTLRTRSSFTVSENDHGGPWNDVDTSVHPLPGQAGRPEVRRRRSDSQIPASIPRSTPASRGGHSFGRGFLDRQRRRPDLPTPAFHEQARMMAGLLR